MTAARRNRQLHRWGAAIVALPFLIIVVSGFFLQLKKHWSWVQPPTLRGSVPELAIPWGRVLELARGVPEAEVRSWDDIDRLDVRVGLGMLKVQCKNHWELQVDTRDGRLLASAHRRSDLLEQIHDGSFFHDKVKLFVWLPVALILFGLWCTGLYLWLQPHLARRRKRARRQP